MKKFLLLFGLALGIFGCEKENQNTTAVNLNFKAVYDGEPLVFIEDDCDYPDGKLVRFQVFNFFISNVALLKESGDEAELVKVDLVDFSENYSVEDANKPFVITGAKAPVGSYKGIRIGFGVPAALNNQDANKHPAGHPLHDHFNSHFYSDWNSFFFMKIEGAYDWDGNGIGQGDYGFMHHVGMDEAYFEMTLSEPVVLEAGKPYDLNFVVDLLDLYLKDGSWIDLTDSSNLTTHHHGGLALSQYLMHNFEQALIIEK